MRIGITLAAGEASRLPNKPLLPIENGQPAITSGVHLLRRSGCGVVIVVVSPRSPLPKILKTFPGMSGLVYVEQTTPGGVPEAIGATASEIGPSDELVVTFCDNVFSDDEIVPRIENTQPLGCVRHLEAMKAMHLDKWDDVWVHRASSSSCECLAGWYRLFSKNVSMAMGWPSSIGFLNAIGAKPYVAVEEWWDIGTPATYREYWDMLDAKGTS